MVLVPGSTESASRTWREREEREGEEREGEGREQREQREKRDRYRSIEGRGLGSACSNRRARRVRVWICVCARARSCVYVKAGETGTAQPALPAATVSGSLCSTQHSGNAAARPRRPVPVLLCNNDNDNNNNNNNNNNNILSNNNSAGARLGQAEVGDLDPLVGPHQQVERLEVPVQDPRVVHRPDPQPTPRV